MSVMIQVRNVPDELHRKLKARAAERKLSLSDYCLRELEQTADLPTLEEWAERVQASPKVTLEQDIAGIIREGREDRWPS